MEMRLFSPEQYFYYIILFLLHDLYLLEVIQCIFLFLLRSFHLHLRSWSSATIPVKIDNYKAFLKDMEILLKRRETNL